MTGDKDSDIGKLEQEHVVPLEGCVLNTRKFKKGIISEATEIWLGAESTLLDLQCQRHILQTIAETLNRQSAFPMFCCVALMMNDGEWYVWAQCAHVRLLVIL
jgi:hypothetical protein